jgi:NAD(P)-dependent dehydrogenase (short-subunit alcohol dehydrogenase family)
MNQIDLEQRNAVVTGGVRGIGYAVARRMQASGANVMVWDSDSAALKALQLKDPDLKVHEVDVTNESNVVDATQAALREFGRLDILVNAAGISGGRSKLVDCSLAEWEQVLRVNLTGTFLCCREIVRTMINTGYGRVVNIGSIAGKEGNAFGSHYSAAKAGVIALTKSLAKEVVADDIRINCIAPAAIDTDFLSGLPDDRRRAALSKIPLGRAGTATEVAALVAWMCSEECSFTTGFAFDLSGGRATY